MLSDPNIHASTAPILQIQHVNVKLMFALLTPVRAFISLSLVWYMYVHICAHVYMGAHRIQRLILTVFFFFYLIF